MIYINYPPACPHGVAATRLQLEGTLNGEMHTEEIAYYACEQCEDQTHVTELYVTEIRVLDPQDFLCREVEKNSTSNLDLQSEYGTPAQDARDAHTASPVSGGQNG